MDPRTLRDIPTGDLLSRISDHERSIGSLARDAAEIEAKVKSLRAEISRQTQQLNTIKNEIDRRNRPAVEPRVSEHAVLRYLERAKAVDVEAARQEILTPAVVAAIQAGASGVIVNGVKFVVQGFTIVTALGEEQRIKNRDHRNGRPVVKVPSLREELDEHFAEQEAE